MPRSNFNFRPALLLIAVTAFQSGLLPSASAQTTVAAKQNAGTPNHTQFGDVTISDWKGFKGNILNLANGHFIGPNILVETTDKTRHLRMQILADDIVGSIKKDKASVEMSGNLRYTITETTETGDRILNGTASRAVYDQELQRLRLLGGVRMTLADPAQFDKPAVVRAGSAAVYTGSKTGSKSGAAGTSMRYVLTGAPGANDIVLSQRGKPRTVNGVVEPLHTTTLHVYNYDSANFTVGQSASFNGAGTTAEAADLEAKTTGTLRAPHIEASFAGKSQEGKLQKASASGGVRYTAQSPGVRGSTQKVAGTSQTASYDLAQKSVVLDGGVEADITDTDALKNPAHLSVGKLSVLLTETPQYLISGSPQRTKIVFTPKPAKQKPPVAPQAANVPAVEQNARAVADAAAVAQAKEKAAADIAGDSAAELAAQKAAEAVAEAVDKGVDKEENRTAEPADQGADAVQNPARKAADQNAAGKKAAVPPFELGTITISGFSSGVYEPGKTATLEGSETTFASNDKATRSSTELKAEKIVAAFSREGEMETTTATKNVHYNLSQPSPSGKVLQDITGTGISVIFSNSETSQQVVVAGPYRANVTNPETLEGPLHIEAPETTDSFTFNLTTKDIHPKSLNGTTVIDFKYREPAVKPKLGAKGTKAGAKSNPAAKTPRRKLTAPEK